MEAVDVLKPGHLGSQAQRALRAVRDSVHELVPSGSAERLRDLAERANADRYLDQVKDLEREYAKRAKRLERTFEKRVKKLPVDTPLDRRRRSRTRRRGVTGAGGLLLLAAVGAAIGYLLWRRRQRDDLDRGSREPYGLTGEATATAPSLNEGNGGAARQRTR
ncbi:MAG TPA: hypothetical protein VLV81_02065 [Acidimicrobiia bacterium]|nr:hypothetical protein [Acidimicrobiia bacterium]